MPKPGRSEEAERSLAYVGMTRAQDMLHILSNSNNGYVNEIAELL